jgi:hypothetical protein
MRAYVSEVATDDPLLFGQAAGGSLRVARRLDEASIALTRGDAGAFQASVEALEAELGTAP